MLNNVSRFQAPVGIFFAALIGLLWFGVSVSRADTHYVSLLGDNTSPFTNGWASAATEIQWAVDAAATTVDTVLVSNGTYNLTNELTISSKDITVKSLYGTNSISTSSIINGNYPDYSNRCVYISGSATIHPVMDGFIITNGYRVVPFSAATALQDSSGGVFVNNGGYLLNCIVGWNKTFNTNVDYGGGGGIYLRPTLADYHVIVSNCYVVSNTVIDPGSGARQGGGILSYYAGAKIIACRISGNQAYSGGGTYFSSVGLVISNCTVDGNTATNYGGIFVSGSTVENCVISNNVGASGAGLYLGGGGIGLNLTVTANTGYGAKLDHGGAMSNCLVTANTSVGISCDGSSYGSHVISDCIIANNLGRGLEISGANARPQLVRNCLIYGNTNSGSVGGAYISYTGPYPYGLINCTIANNQANTLGGGIYATTTNNYIANCIIYGNVTTNAGDNTDEVYVNTAAGTNNFWYNCAPTNLVAGQGNTTNNPLFINAGNRNYRLGSGSPCINTGTNMSWMANTNAFDLDGILRIRYGRVDMGAYEAIYSGTICGFR